MSEKPNGQDSELNTFKDEQRTAEDLITTLQTFLPVIDIESGTLSCVMPPFYQRHIRELVEWDRFREEVETVLEKWFESFFTSHSGLRLEWSHRWLDFYITMTNWTWMSVNDYGQYNTHNADNTGDLNLFSHALNIYLGILYTYLSVYSSGDVPRDKITDIEKISSGKIIKLNSISGCKIEDKCQNRDPFNCSECVRSLINTLSSFKKPEQLVDHFKAN